ncbi:cocaine esterase [Molossus nigricans]
MVANLSACVHVELKALVDCLWGKSEDEILTTGKVPMPQSIAMNSSISPASSRIASQPAHVRADHGDEMFFVFGTSSWSYHIEVTEEEELLSKKIMKY